MDDWRPAAKRSRYDAAYCWGVEPTAGAYCGSLFPLCQLQPVSGKRQSRQSPGQGYFRWWVRSAACVQQPHCMGVAVAPCRLGWYWDACMSTWTSMQTRAYGAWEAHSVLYCGAFSAAVQLHLNLASGTPSAQGWMPQFQRTAQMA